MLARTGAPRRDAKSKGLPSWSTSEACSEYTDGDAPLVCAMEGASSSAPEAASIWRRERAVDMETPFSAAHAPEAEGSGRVGRVEGRQQRDAHEHRITVAIDDVERARAAELEHVGVALRAAVAGDEQRVGVVHPFPHQAVHVAHAPGVRRAADVWQLLRCRAFVPG